MKNEFVALHHERSNALDGVRFRCDIGNDMARKIAANLRVNIDNYLFYT